MGRRTRPSLRLGRHRLTAAPGCRGPGARSAERSELALEGGASTWQLATLGLIDRRIYPQILPKTQ